jgi:adenylate kinase family enzyme
MDEIQMIVSSSVPVEDEQKEVSTARRNLVTELLARVSAGKSAHKKAFDRMKADMDLAFYGYDPKNWDDDKYVVNLAQRHVQQRTAALYAKNPRAVAKPRRRMLSTIWDGKPETIEQAKAVQQMAQEHAEPIPQAVAMVLAEYEQISSERRRLDKIGETLEILFHYFMQDAQPTFKSQMKALVRRMLTTGVGYVKLGFQRETERRPEVSARMNDIQVRLDHLETLAKDSAEGKINESSAEFEELQLAFKDLMTQAEVIVREGLMFDFPDSTAIIVDPRCKQLRGFIGARWIAHEMFFTTEEVREIYGVEIDGNYTPYDVKGRSHDSSRKSLAANGSQDKEEAEEGMVCVYELYDKPSGLVYVIAEGHKDFLKEPAGPELQVETFWPVFSLVCNEVEHQTEIYPPSDVHLMRSMVSEYNRAREGLREHRKANRPTYLTPAGMLEDEDKEKLATRPAHAVLSIQGMQPGQKSEDLVTALRTVGIDPNLYEVGTVFDDVQLAVGAQEANFGGTAGATATETSLAESSRMSALGAQVDELDSFMSEITRCAGAILLQQMSVDQVKTIAGPGAVWPELTAQEIADEVILEIEAGSTGKPNQAAELRNLERVLPFVIQIPGIDPKWLAKEVLKRMDDKLDLDAALADGVGSIVSMNGMSDPNAAAGMNQGAAGAANAPTPGAPGVGPTGPTQMMM